MASYADNAIRATVRGLVQGVGFRYTTIRVAREAAVAGWVRNLSGGSVEVWAQGSAAAVEDMHRFLEVGPGEAVVISVDLAEVEPDLGLAGFEITF